MSDNESKYCTHGFLSSPVKMRWFSRREKLSSSTRSFAASDPPAHTHNVCMRIMCTAHKPGMHTQFPHANPPRAIPARGALHPKHTLHHHHWSPPLCQPTQPHQTDGHPDAAAAPTLDQQRNSRENIVKKSSRALTVAARPRHRLQAGQVHEERAM